MFHPNLNTRRVFLLMLHHFIVSLPSVDASNQCNLGLKLFSVESGNAICAPIAPFECVEICEWVEADRGGCSLSSHYTAFRGRRTYLAGMVLTEGSFLVQCCASLATSVLLNADQEPICRWSEQIDTVVDKPTVRFDSPLAEHEYFRDLRGTRFGRGGAKIQAEICRYLVQRTNCDRKIMAPEEAHQYSLLLLRLQRTREFFQNGHSGIINAGSSNPLNPVNDRERARAEHRTIYKNTTNKLGQLELIGDGKDSAVLKEAAAALENDNSKINSHSEEEEAKLPKNSLIMKEPQMTTTTTAITESPTKMNSILTISTTTTTTNMAPESRTTTGMGITSPRTTPSGFNRILYNGGHRQSLRTRIHQNGHQDGGPQLTKHLHQKLAIPVVGVPPSRPILPDTSHEATEQQQQRQQQQASEQTAAAARGVRELLYRAAKHGTSLLKKLNRHQQQEQRRKFINATMAPRLLLPIRRLRPFPPKDDQMPTANGVVRPVRMQMSRLGWPKGLRRRLWPVVATNTTMELIPTRTDVNWIDNEFFDEVNLPKANNERGEMSGTIRVIERNVEEPKRVRMDQIRPPQPAKRFFVQKYIADEVDDDGPLATRHELRIKKLGHKSVANSNGQMDEDAEVPAELEQKQPIRRKEEAAPREMLMGSAGGDGLAEGGGGSFAPEVPPTQQQILPFHAIKEISTSPLGSAPQFRVVPFAGEKKASSKFVGLTRRDGQVRHQQQMPFSSSSPSVKIMKLLDCCHQQAPGCREVCTRDVSKEQIKKAMSSGQCPPLSMTSVIQCFPRFYNISTVGECCANGGVDDNEQSHGTINYSRLKALPPQCLSLCAADFHLSFAHLACVEHSELILHCYRRLLEQFEGIPTMGGDHQQQQQPFAAAKR